MDGWRRRSSRARRRRRRRGGRHGGDDSRASSPLSGGRHVPSVDGVDGERRSPGRPAGLPDGGAGEAAGGGAADGGGDARRAGGDPRGLDDECSRLRVFVQSLLGMRLPASSSSPTTSGVPDMTTPDPAAAAFYATSLLARTATRAPTDRGAGDPTTPTSRRARSAWGGAQAGHLGARPGWPRGPRRGGGGGGGGFGGEGRGEGGEGDAGGGGGVAEFGDRPDPRTPARLGRPCRTSRAYGTRSFFAPSLPCWRASA